MKSELMPDPDAHACKRHAPDRSYQFSDTTVSAIDQDIGLDQKNRRSVTNAYSCVWNDASLLSITTAVAALDLQIQEAITYAIVVRTSAVLLNFPVSSRNKFLYEDRKSLTTSCLTEQRGETKSGMVTWMVVLSVVKEPQIWAMYAKGLIRIFEVNPVIQASHTYNAPMGYADAFHLYTPPVAFANASPISISGVSDNTPIQSPFAVIKYGIAIVELSITGLLNSPAPRYVDIFVRIAGTTALTTTVFALGQSNVRSDARSVTTVMQVVICGYLFDVLVVCGIMLYWHIPKLDLTLPVIFGVTGDGRKHTWKQQQASARPPHLSSSVYGVNESEIVGLGASTGQRQG
ncbi:uncharacterized protein NECHADRAFT_89415 [Fusarium vanettenii 77-13-4]|uniref:Uncharacterized protein n=1 Tax=Fusarium vanettenii (strain ATCC MYA-4622 / CBS 123669 / FGSC 9596 / NRRL 45880 / 77-13-4) TaxID=660122 RepID=C7ZR48_FUSV7|nr:uncharacterized protein NECHADRAFT_89415 [Fusarium vanettenii 77-13-4]EEU33513.1 hypothetical protein NECHADRAFT_89415 [Fusarium vanettenii 77-13-4]